MNTAASTAWLGGPLPWCCVCLSHRVRDHAAYECAVCDPRPLPPVPRARLPLDRTISTTAGEA